MTPVLNCKSYSNPNLNQIEIPTSKLIKKGTIKSPQNRINMTSMLGRKSLPNKAKGDENNAQQNLQLV